jgi:hypothetical protein
MEAGEADAFAELPLYHSAAAFCLKQSLLARRQHRLFQK